VSSAPPPSESPLVIVVHGLWWSGFQLTVIKNRLEADGSLRAVMFSYPSIADTMSDHVRSLIDFARAQKTAQLHFVGHSLGGLVILRALQVTADLPPGRAVLLGTPLQGSRAAQGMARLLPFGKALLGAAIREECIEWSPRQWSGPRDIGVIAGSMGFGLGRLFAQFDADHDGTVMVAETRLPGAKDHIVLPTSHTGLVFSAEVARQTGYFLRNGMFKREADSPAGSLRASASPDGHG
jgi:pimeloyl-ACP methyl ester carboxylesterase